MIDSMVEVKDVIKDVMTSAKSKAQLKTAGMGDDVGEFMPVSSFSMPSSATASTWSS